MDNTRHRFDRDITLAKRKTRAYQAMISPHWSINGVPDGGYLMAIVAAAMLREMGPLITAILLAGRTGSAFAAEIGTMKVTEELDALTTFGINPLRFLVIPRILAAIFVTPLLSVFASFIGIIGGYVVFNSLGYPLS